MLSGDNSSHETITSDGTNVIDDSEVYETTEEAAVNFLNCRFFEWSISLELGLTFNNRPLDVWPKLRCTFVSCNPRRRWVTSAGWRHGRQLRSIAVSFLYNEFNRRSKNTPSEESRNQEEGRHHSSNTLVGSFDVTKVARKTRHLYWGWYLTLFPESVSLQQYSKLSNSMEVQLITL